MAADLSSVVNAAYGSRAFWDSLADAAAWTVAGGVALEEIVEFRFIKKRIGKGCRDTLAKLGWFILLLGLVAELGYGRKIREQTDITEHALTQSLNQALDANKKLAGKIEQEKTDIRGVKTITDQQKTDLATAQGQITALQKDAQRLGRRFLLPSQIAAMSNAGRNMPTLQIEFARDSDEPEYAKAIARAIGMKRVPQDGGSDLQPIWAADGGISVFADPEHAPQAKALVRAFKAAKLPGPICLALLNENKGWDFPQIFIGRRIQDSRAATCNPGPF